MASHKGIEFFPFTTYVDRAAQMAAPEALKYANNVGWTGVPRGRSITVLNPAEGPTGLVLKALDTVPACSPVKARITEAEFQAAIPENLRSRLQGVPVALDRYKNSSIGSVCKVGASGESGTRCKQATCRCDDGENQSARFQIVAAGTLMDAVKDEAAAAQLDSYMENATPVSWRHLRALVPENKYFYFSTFRFSLIEQLQPIAGGAGIPLALSMADPPVFEVCGENLALPVTPDEPEGDRESRVRAMMPPTSDTEGVGKAMAEFSTLWTDGLLKSFIQKAVRFRPREIRFADGTAVKTRTAVMVAAAHLLCSRGGYSPNIHKMVRGYVAAFKRIAVIAVEDGIYFGRDNAIQTVYSLLTTAYVLERRDDYYPTVEFCKACIKFVGRCARSSDLIDWRNETNVKHEVALRRGEAGVGRLAPVLRELGSFSGDIAMLAVVDTMGHSLPIIASNEQHGEMPVCHMIDQHTTPAFSYALVEDGLSTFAARNTAVFEMVTGFNPRRKNTLLHVGADFVQGVRAAQDLVMGLAKKRRDLAVGDEKVSIDVVIDYGTLAGDVGAVLIPKDGAARPAMLAMLPTTEGGEESAVLKILQGPKAKEIFAQWTAPDNEANRAKHANEAIDELRKKVHVLRNPQLTGRGFKTAVYRDGLGWCVGDAPDYTPWTDARKGSVECVVLPAAPFPGDFLSLRCNNTYVLDGTADGMREGAETECKKLMEAVPLPTLLRFVGVLRTQDGNFSLPVPARDGSLAADEEWAMDGDWDVWRLLTLVAYQVPGALWTGPLPRFRVKATIVGIRLLRLVCTWAGAIADRRVAANAAGRTTLTEQERVGQNVVTLKPHQDRALNELLKNNRQNNVLVMMTGMGKTYVALRYALFRLSQSTAKHILWFAPSSAVNDIEKMATNMGLTSQVFANAKAPTQKRAIAALATRAERVFVISMDLARKITREILEVAPNSYCVFDELDSYFGATKRSSVMLAVAGACLGFLGMTATPFPNRQDIVRFCKWLRLCVGFPVTSENLIVALSSCVEIASTHNIRKIYDFIGIEFPSAKLVGATELMDTPHQLYQYLQDTLDPEFAKIVTGLAEKGNAVFVVCDTADHCRKIKILVDDQYGGRTGIYSTEKPDVLHDPEIKVVFVSKTFDRGYNGGERFNHMVRQVYGMGTSARLQMEGRLLRLKQQSPEVTFTTVYITNSTMAERLDVKCREELNALQTTSLQHGTKRERR